MSDPRKLLFITSTRIGDAVLGSGLLAHVLAEMPGCRVTVAGGALVAPLFAGVPGLERFIAMKKQPWAGHWRSLWRQTVGTRWDTILDLRGSIIGFGLRRKSLIRWSSHVAGQGHQVERLARVLGVMPPPSPRLFPSDAQRAAAASFLPKGRPILALGPTANGRGKEWSPERYAEIAHWVTANGGLMPGAEIVVFGAPEDEERMAPLFAAMADLSVTSCFNIGDLGTVGQAIAGCQLYIGNDSGLMHIAAASGIPTFGLFGGSPMDRYGPWGAKAGGTASPLPLAEAMVRYSQGTLPMNWLPVDQVKRDLAVFWARVSA
jgi:lipopolysaccharide export system permease protein